MTTPQEKRRDEIMADIRNVLERLEQLRDVVEKYPNPESRRISMAIIKISDAAIELEKL